MRSEKCDDHKKSMIIKKNFLLYFHLHRLEKLNTATSKNHSLYLGVQVSIHHVYEVYDNTPSKIARKNCNLNALKCENNILNLRYYFPQVFQDFSHKDQLNESLFPADPADFDNRETDLDSHNFSNVCERKHRNQN